MTTEPLVLRLEEPGDDPLSDQVFEILCGVLQPNSEHSVEASVEQITTLLPEGQPYSSEVASFLTPCYEIAEQTPYYHTSMVKLVTVIDICLNSSKLAGRAGANEDFQTMRYQKLQETLTDWWDSTYPDENPTRFINFQTFVAHVYERGLVEGRTLPIFLLRNVFDEGWGITREARNAYIKAALQYILLCGEAIYHEVTENEYSTRFNNWRHWHEQVSVVAASKADAKGWTYSEDVVEMARRAEVAMEAVERLKAG